MRVLLWLFFATLSAILFLQLRGFDSDLKADGAGCSIITYELAWSATAADSCLSGWRDNRTIKSAKVSLGVDFVFLLAYPAMFFTGAALLLRKPAVSSFDRIGAVLQRAVLACIPLDAAENLLLWRMIDHGASDPLAHLATLVAGIKFLLVGATLVWCLAALGRRVVVPRGA